MQNQAPQNLADYCHGRLDGPLFSVVGCPVFYNVELL